MNFAAFKVPMYKDNEANNIVRTATKNATSIMRLCINYSTFIFNQGIHQIETKSFSKFQFINIGEVDELRGYGLFCTKSQREIAPHVSADN